MNLKHKLPLCSEVEHLFLTHKELEFCQNLFFKLDNEFKSALEANSQLCRFHNSLTNETYSELLQINLTDSIHENANLDLEDFNNQESLGSYKTKMQLSKNINSVFSEHSFTKPSDTYNSNKDFFDDFKKKFKSPPTRMRMVKLPAGKNITPHIDYDPSFAVRIIIPIQSNKDCLNLFWNKKHIETINMEIGKAYFLNTGFRHAVCNLSNEVRYTLMITINGYKDIEHLMAEDKNVCV